MSAEFHRARCGLPPLGALWENRVGQFAPLGNKGDLADEGSKWNLRPVSRGVLRRCAAPGYSCEALIVETAPAASTRRLDIDSALSGRAVRAVVNSSDRLSLDSHAME
jgi:hypothetical protein